MDAVTLDHLLAEVGPLLLGRRLGRVRPLGATVVGFDLGGGRLLRLDATRGRAGLFLLERSESIPVAGASSGSTRQALLHLRKHAAGRKLVGLERLPGERVLVIRL